MRNMRESQNKNQPISNTASQPIITDDSHDEE
jgi:hypothetical protein